MHKSTIPLVPSFPAGFPTVDVRVEWVDGDYHVKLTSDADIIDVTLPRPFGVTALLPDSMAQYEAGLMAALVPLVQAAATAVIQRAAMNTDASRTTMVELLRHAAIRWASAVDVAAGPQLLGTGPAMETLLSHASGQLEGAAVMYTCSLVGEGSLRMEGDRVVFEASPL